MLAAGCVLFAAPASALELGELTVESSLGQPLRASIAYALAPHEQLASYCIFVRGGAPDAGIPGVTGAYANVANGRILVQSRAALREPIMNLQLTVDCAYTPHVRREYLLMLNPATARSSVAGTQTAATESRRDADATRRTGTAAQPAALRPATPIALGSRYRVQAGDTLSDIAARIPERKLRLWPAVDALFAANPDAFIDGDRNRLVAGAELIVPAALSDAGVAATATSVPAATTVAPRATDEADAAVRIRAAAETADAAATTAAAPTATVSTGIETVEATQESGEAPPEAAPTVAIPEARIDVPAEPVPVVGNRVSADDIGGDNSLSWLMWLGGTGIAIILGLLLFGRTLRERIGSALAVPEPRRRRTDRGEDALASSLADDLENTIARAKVFALDADLGDGAGFDSNPDMDVAQDFGFADSGDYGKGLDLHFDENSTREQELVSTDMISAPAFNESVIVDKEVLPSYDEDEDDAGYDLSMVVDATKQNFADAESTTRDLHAVEVSALDAEDLSTGSFTINEEAGHRLIEMDYEVELTATQALNRDIEQAARELAERLDQDATAEMPGSDDASRRSAQAGDDPTEISMARDLDDTAEIATDMPAAGLAVNEQARGDEATVEMPADQNEVTVEMEPKRARGRPRRSKAS